MYDTVEREELKKYGDMVARLRSSRGRAMITQLPASELVSKDERELISIGRFGDLLISDWELGRNTMGELRCTCGCGESMNFSPAKLASMVYANWDRQYLMSGSDLAANSQAQPYWCAHIQKAMEEEFQTMHELHKRAMTQIRRAVSRGQGVAYTLSWMDRSTGFYEFVKDVGLPPGPDMELVRVTSPGHTAENFRWIQDGRENGPTGLVAVAENPTGLRGAMVMTDDQLRKVSSRYTSLRSRVLTEGKGFGWNSFAEFLESIKRKAPVDFTPEAYQLRFINTETYGYCEKSMGFHLLGKARRYLGGSKEGGKQPRNYARAPWNAAIELENMAETWPLMELDLSPTQYLFFCFEFSRLMASEPGDVHEHIEQARATASHYKA